MKIYKHKKNDSIIISSDLNDSRSVEIVGEYGSKPNFLRGRSDRNYELYYGKVFIKTSTEYDINETFIISDKDYIFFHCKNDENLYYISKYGATSISTCSYGVFKGHIRDRKILKDVLEFRNKKRHKRKNLKGIKKPLEW